MPQIREPAVAGLFYPDDPLLLQQQVDNLLAQEVAVGAAPKALIVPHAGFIYSGPVAASAYLQLASVREQIQRVVLLGPAHRVAFSGVAASSARYFSTPLGMVRIDQQAMDAILGLPKPLMVSCGIYVMSGVELVRASDSLPLCPNRIAASAPFISPSAS